MPNVRMGKSRPGIAGRIGTTRVAPKPYWPGLEDDYDFDYDHGVDVGVTKLKNDEPVIPVANESLASPAVRVKENQPEGVHIDETSSTPQRSRGPVSPTCCCCYFSSFGSSASS
jgi:hypothetical protein